MIEAYVTDLAVTAAQGPITFANKNSRGYSVRLAADNQTFNFNLPGVYKVDVSVTGRVTAGGTLSVQVYADGKPVVRAQGQSVTAANENQNIAFSTLLTVSPAVAGSQASITVNYSGAAGTLQLADVVITKVG